MVGPFALTAQLRPLLAAARGSRIVSVASVMHRKAALPDDLEDFFRWVRLLSTHFRSSAIADRAAGAMCSHLIGCSR